MTAVSVRRAGPGDEEEVARFEPAFDHEVSPVETRRMLEDDRHHLLLGYVDGRPAGFTSAVEVFHPDKRPELFLNEIGVVETERRRGVARALIEELIRVGRERGALRSGSSRTSGTRRRCTSMRAAAVDGTERADP